MKVRRLQPGDAARVSLIHQAGLATGHASFREVAMTTAEVAGSFSLCLVAESEGVLGYAGVGATSARPVYSGVGEVSVYVAPEAAGRGVGRALLTRLVSESEEAGWWTLVAQIFPENAGSLALHRACGFEVLGVRRGLGRMGHGPMAGRWRDVVMMERRSAVAGVAEPRV